MPTEARASDVRHAPEQRGSHDSRAAQKASAEENLTTALARLESRWGSAAVRLASDVGYAPERRGSHDPRAAAPKATAEEDLASGSRAASKASAEGRDMHAINVRRGPTSRPGPQVDGALALALSAQPAPELVPPDVTRPSSLPDEVVPTGFARLDALLGTGGLPRGVSASFRGARSSGKTALALHCLAQAQARGGIVAFLDLCRIFDPLEAAGRGVDLRWLLVLRPADVDEGWALAAALVAGRQVDLLVVDLPARLRASHDTALRRLAAHARRSSVCMIVLEPTGLAPPVHGALAESVALRLELEQRAWLRAGRDIVGRCVSVSVAKNRFGPPGRETEIEIRYLFDGEHGAAIERFGTADLPSSSPVVTRIQPRPRQGSQDRLNSLPPSHLAAG